MVDESVEQRHDKNNFKDGVTFFFLLKLKICCLANLTNYFYQLLAC